MPLVEMGVPTVTRAREVAKRHECLGRARRVPLTAMGSTSAPVSMASRKAPSLKGSRSSVFERVPSGKIITGMPLSSQRAQMAMAA